MFPAAFVSQVRIFAFARSSVKAEFIRAKYEQLAFVHRPPRRDDDDLGKQLHSSVRTANLDTSLRLLSLGAHANYFHHVSGNERCEKSVIQPCGAVRVRARNLNCSFHSGLYRKATISRHI